ncbi:MAG: 1-(5-phosphoribosyl)-5-[(5-phosphoribosylamino)methylideneamino]imidazole-4-carboxamide isomerase [Nitrososphaerota archaeon]|nr:1-(5-phosphoribosyl)-5-[(5-phosphoribosylamino)methylideneamino]imidazole-4-carboxamide isomerase [Nitrososphaerota archaeon]
MMQLWAAIDLMNGSAVTLVQGKESDRTVWGQEPPALAERWEREGADGLHIIDLDAAFERGSNREVIEEIVREVGIPVQVGGGIRRDDVARAWLDAGAGRVVLGTMAYGSRPVLTRLLRDYGPDRIVVAADYKDGQIVTKGWREGRGVSVESAAEDFERAGVVNLLTTSVGRDGMRAGPDVETVRRLAEARKLSVIASGGIRDIADLVELRDAGAGGAVIGRALYEGTVNLAEAKKELS